MFLTIIPLCLNHSQSPLQPPKINSSALRSKEVETKCDIFSGKWIPYPNGPYYSNLTCSLITDQQNCMKFGRPDTEFMKWRWKPDECELPLFDAVQFLELVRGKSIAFVGDSVGRNQMHSLLCLLASVSTLLYTSYTDFEFWNYADYNFTLAVLWSPFLVKAHDADPEGHSLNSLMSLYLDEVDESWASQIEIFDYVIISAGQWFFRPLIYYENNQAVKCHSCHIKNITAVTLYYGYRMAFRTAFQAILRLKDYKGITFLRTFSPNHFENGDWNKGGNCVRTRPFTNQEKKFDGYIKEMYLTQVEEFRTAEKHARTNGLRFGLLDTSEIMLLRADGHPNHYGHLRDKNVTVADCVHWCLPGPIDTWNEFLLYMLKTR
ncbi:PC-Esterase domain-containing protein/PMR5N domain-containing protein [Cephalotus follicularis]|uniref:PC-Esterase domain-containing protein/PMR5N domain-containing protein n=1 Tax=Cephalotus follicularis TaxID=3775 RepID=A0A1Q3DBU4_CEPFO|nr:PC-Esterase domain-containing protein/PMR5N domain-containing protein [Cephalotus follicularis]